MSLFTDLNELTGVSKQALIDLAKHANYCIGHKVYEDNINQNYLTELDLGIGTLFIKTTDSDVRYKFIPSPELEKSVTHAVNKRSPIAVAVNDKLREKLESTFKGLL